MEDVVFAGIDPGMHGGLAIKDGNKISVYSPPLLKKIKDKQDYDIAGMAAILRPYQNRNVIICIEAVFSFKAQGVSSMFNFGRGKGIWEGIAHAFGFHVFMISPQRWKKHFDLIHKHIKPLHKPKTEEEKKAAEKERRLIKVAAKVKSRELASKLYPELASSFVKVNSDGLAEAVLIAHYAEQHKDELLKTKEKADEG